MRLGICCVVVAALALSRSALAQVLDVGASPFTNLLAQIATMNQTIQESLNTQEDPFSSETAPSPWGSQQINNGSAHFSLDFAYANRYVYRGVNHDVVATHGNSLNLLLDGRLEFDLGKYPHPFFELFTNIYDADPLSRFQEIRPIAGIDWDLRPFDLQVEQISYIYPQREQYNLPEIDTKVTVDDSLLWDTSKPVLSPYVLGAYVYQKNEGWYLEFGLKHDFYFEDIGLTLTPEANVAWITGLRQQFVIINNVQNTGWQHYEFGLSVSYSLNFLLNLSQRFGEFDVKGYGFYDGRFTNQITSSNALWGGVGLGFKY